MNVAGSGRMERGTRASMATKYEAKKKHVQALMRTEKVAMRVATWRHVQFDIHLTRKSIGDVL